MKYLKNVFVFCLVISMFFIPVSAVDSESNEIDLVYVSDEVMDVNAYNYYRNLGSPSILAKSQLSDVSPLSICVEGACLISSKEISGITQQYQDQGTYMYDTMYGTNSSGTVYSCYTIAKSGCALTSFAMYLSKLGKTQTPGQVNAKFGNFACTFNASFAANRYEIDYQIVYTNGGTNGLKMSGYWPIIKGIVLSGKTAIIGMINWDTMKGHFVLVKGYYEFDDPSFNYIKIFNTNITSVNFTLGQYTEDSNNNWAVTRIYTFSN